MPSTSSTTAFRNSAAVRIAPLLLVQVSLRARSMLFYNLLPEIQICSMSCLRRDSTREPQSPFL